jgi:hypothetical protein
MSNILPTTRIPLIKIQPEVGTYKAYVKEYSQTPHKDSVLFFKDDVLNYNRKLVNSFKSGYTK